MRSVSVDGAVARIGAGASLGDVYEALHEHGLAIPAGTCPSVGIAGLTLGGGLGILGRKYGVTSDRLIAQRSSWPTAESSAATSTTTATCSGRSGARAPAPSAS
jgi:FAD/FMN-containing dehydrogenases